MLPRYYSDEVRQNVLELHDNHTFWNINKNITDEDLYNATEIILGEFEGLTGENLLLLGRSGRHACLYDTKKNQLHYHRYKKIALELEKILINRLNNL